MNLFYLIIPLLSISFIGYSQNNYVLTPVSASMTNDGELLEPWYFNKKYSEVYEVNKSIVQKDAEDHLLKKVYNNDSLGVISPYFDEGNANKMTYGLLSDNMISFNGRLFFQGYYHPVRWSRPCVVEANIMAWDGVNAPYFLPPAFTIPDKCYSGNVSDPNPVFRINNFIEFRDTLFYGGFTNRERFFYLLDEHDSSRTAVHEGESPEDIAYVYKTFVAGDNLYLVCARNDDTWGLFTYQGFQKPPHDLGISFERARDINFVNFIPIKNRLHVSITDGNANYDFRTILPNGTILNTNPLGNASDVLKTNQYVYFKKHTQEGFKWFYLSYADLDTPVEIPALSALEYFRSFGNIDSEAGQVIEDSKLYLVGSKDDHIFLEQRYFYSVIKRDGGGNVQTDSSVSYDTTTVFMYGPDSDFPITKDTSPCNLTHSATVQHIADCSLTDDVSKTQGDILFQVSGEAPYNTTWYFSEDKKNWTLIKSHTYTTDTLNLQGLAEGYYKAIIEDQNCTIETPYYEIKSLKGTNSKEYLNYTGRITIQDFGSLPVEATLITSIDTTTKYIFFDLLSEQTFELKNGNNYLITSDQSGCTNIDTFTLGVTSKPIEIINLCDSIQVSFDVVNGTPPYTTVIRTTLKDTLFYSVNDAPFQFNETIAIPTGNSDISIVVKDKLYDETINWFEQEGKINTKYYPYSRPNISAKIQPPNCNPLEKQGSIDMEVFTFHLENFVYSWLDNDLLSGTEREIEEYGTYYFSARDTIFDCVFTDTIVVEDPFKDYDYSASGIDSLYKTCADNYITIGDDHNIYAFSRQKDLSTIFNTTNKLAFTTPEIHIDSTIYFAPYQEKYQCLGNVDSIKIKSMEFEPVSTSDSILCEIGNKVSFTSEYEGTTWFVDSYPRMGFDGKGASYSFNTNDSSHVVYACYIAQGMFCKVPFDTIHIRYNEPKTPFINHPSAKDSIISCDTIKLDISNYSNNSQLYWISGIDTTWSPSPILQMPPPFKGEIYVFEQLGKCMGEPSNKLFVNNSNTLPSILIDVSHDSIVANIGIENLTKIWYKNGQPITSNDSFILPEESGIYQLKIIDNEYGCSTLSNELVYKKTTQNINVYPIPTEGIITIQTPLFYSVTLYNTSGKKLDTFLSNTIDLRSYSSNVYIAEIRLNNDQIHYRKIIKE